VKLAPRLAAALAAALFATAALASEGEHAREIAYPEAEPVPESQDEAEVARKSAGCTSCHTPMDEPTMHATPGVELGCTDCHGGSAEPTRPAQAFPGARDYEEVKARAHVQPRYPRAWGLDDEGRRVGPRPPRAYTLYNREAPEFIRFVNPGDLRIAAESCGVCHAEIVKANQRSLMATGAMLWGGAAYNNGLAEFKRYALGEAYTREGRPARIESRFALTPELARRGVLPFFLPLPSWETFPPADNFRVFERGGKFNATQFPEIGLPRTLDDPGKPDARQSNRGEGTGARIAVPLLNIHKTRLNDPFLWFPGTNDNPGDFRASGCSACHVVYANDREKLHSGPYAAAGHWGQSQSADPTIAGRVNAAGARETGHPLKHAFTRAIPTAQCMTCHMHQPNMFVNSYLGYTMWDYEADAKLMWPEQQAYPSIPEMHARLERNPEEANSRGRWGDTAFLSRVWDDVNPEARDTQFADYHGHGWNFRGVFKRDRKGQLLDAANRPVPDDLPPAEKWKRAVHLRDIHAERGMQCADCHFAQDSHGDGFLRGEVAAAVEIGCIDCHGTSRARATLKTSGPAAPPRGNDLRFLRNADGGSRFVWRGEKLYQRLVLPPHEEREVTQVIDTITPGNPRYNAKAARAKTIERGPAQRWGNAASGCERAHDEEKIACFTCHSSWVTSCGGCHLPIQANWKTERHHFEGGETRNFATYNPQVARDEMFQLGRHGEVKNGIIAPVRSSSALVLSSTDINRNRIYVQQPPVSAAGFSAQAFAPHFPHTVRKTETKTCTDCHVSERNDNNAVMAQLLLLGTNFVNFTGYNAWVGGERDLTAIQVTEWDEPQAVIGSYLHRYAYPDWYAEHQKRGRELTAITPGALDADPSWVASLRRFFQGRFFGGAIYDGTYGHGSGRIGCLQLRGEYLYAAEGSRGMQAFDISSIANKGFSERVITAPFSPLGQNLRVRSKSATCVALPTTQPVRPERNRRIRAEHPENLEQPMHPIYSYAAVTDAEEGLILVDIETLGDFEPRNNYFRRALTWNPGGILDGARYAHFAGHILYVTAKAGIVAVDLDDPLEPRMLAKIELSDARASMQQFRYLFAVDREGLQVIDVTEPAAPRRIPSATIPLADAQRVFVSRTYAYVAAGREGLAIIDIERPEAPRLVQRFTAGGYLNDARDVIVSTTNASLFAYVADGANGLKVLQLTSPESQPRFYGFSPEPKPELIASRRTASPALSLSRPLERDRAVDETGHQIAVFGRLGSRPFDLEEMHALYLREDGRVWTVDDAAAPLPSTRGGCLPPAPRPRAESSPDPELSLALGERSARAD
jgi:hypothetical protein